MKCFIGDVVDVLVGANDKVLTVTFTSNVGVK